MPFHISWWDITIRLLSTVFAGFVIGFDRGERGRPAGLRTTILVALAASISMIQVNLLMPTTGKTPESFVVFDLMRLPLGILTGVGFIGGGAIVRRDNMVLGVTTAATLWFVTVIGLCFGGGQLGLGFASLLIGFLVLTGLRSLEHNMKHDRHATLKLVTVPGGPGEDELRSILSAEHYRIRSIGLLAGEALPVREWNCAVEWRGRKRETTTPEFVKALAGRPGVSSVEWKPEER
ncbi:MAG TPA: MgtC/SapB family protein [Bryobacteraceae bacterium]|jgi:putative Mg2+ transporter-C (MgtC) family protein|nr:MgtC/SapB family protein [Bryobacteraceae bacterium]